MAYEFKFPDVGEGITEGEIVKWKVKPGDMVKVDEVLAEVETDKAVVEIPSPKAGKIVKIFGKEGDIINVGDTLVEIDETGKAEVKEEAAAEGTVPKAKEIEKPSKEGAMPAKEEKPAKPLVEEKAPPKKPKGASVVGVLEEAPDEEEVKEVKKEHVEKKKIVSATPAARKLAEEKGVDLSAIKGTGPESVITEKDIGASAAAAPKAKHVRKYDLWGYVDRQPFKGMRKSIARHMEESVAKTAPVTHMDEADVTELWGVRNKEKGVAEKQGIKLTFLPFVIKAVIAGLKEHPMLNSELDEENENIILKKYYNIGIAIDTGNGLVVPVIKGADEKSILQLAKEIEALAQKTRDRKIDPGDLKGGSFSITNWGSIGGRHGTPIIKYPECAILGIGRIFEKVVMIKGNITTRKILPISVTFNHKITDGAEAARFTNVVIQHLEDPDLMLIEAEG